MRTAKLIALSLIVVLVFILLYLAVFTSKDIFEFCWWGLAVSGASCLGLIILHDPEVKNPA